MICKWRIFVFFCCRAAGSEQQVIECFCQRSLLLRLVVIHWLSQYFRLGGRSVIFHRLAQLQGFFGLTLAGLDLREFDDAIVFKVALMVKKYLSNNPAKY